MDALLALLRVAAGINFVMGVPGANNIMLGYQSAPHSTTHSPCATCFRQHPAQEFETWLNYSGIDRHPPVASDGRNMPAHFRAMLPAS